MATVSQAQHAMMVEDLRRLEADEPTRTGMTREQLEEFVATPVQHLPDRVKPKKRKY